MQKKILDLVYNLSLKRGKLLLIIMTIITLFFSAFIPNLIISSSQKNLIPKDDPEQAKFIKFQEEFGVSDNLIVVLDGDSDVCKEYADDFATEIEKEKKWVKSLFYKIDTSVLVKRAPLFVSVKDLNKGFELINKKKSWIERIQNVSSLYAVLNEITSSFKEPNTDISIDSASKIITFLDALFVEWNDWLTNPNQIKLKLAEKLAQKPGFSELGRLQSGGYLFSRDFKMLFILVQPRDYDDEITYLRPFVADIRKACDRVFKAHPEIKGKIKVAFTGVPAYTLTNTELVYSDIGSAGILSIVFVALVLLIGFRSIKKTIIGIIPTLSGLLISLGIITIFLKHLNLISSSFLAVLFGIGIDFSIYLLQRTEEELGNGLSMNEAIYKSVVLTSRSIISGGLTTSFAFIALALSDFQGYAELGKAAGIGLIVVMITTFTMMPALLMLIPVEARDYNIKEALMGTKRLEQKKFHLVIIGASVIITILSIIAATQIKMDYNVLKLLPSDSEATIYLNKMEVDSDIKSSTAMIYDNDLGHLKIITEKVKNLKTVSKVESLAELIPDNQQEKIKIIKKFKPLLGNFRIALVNNDRSNADYIAVIDTMSTYFEDAQEKAFAGGQSELVKQIDDVLKIMGTIKEHLSSDKHGVALARTKQFEKELFSNFEKATQIIRESFEPEIITENTFPKELLNRFKSSKGTYVTMVSPTGSIWDVDFLDKFVNDLKNITPNVTGFPITHKVYIRQAASSIFEAMILSLGVIIILLIIDFRRVNTVLLSLLPLVIGMLWIQLALFILKIDYNVANIGGLPLLLGLGIVYGLRIVHRWKEDMTITAFAATKTTGRGLAFAAFAILAGLVSIVPAHHRGVSSFGWILLIGIISCMFTALFILPAVIDVIYVIKKNRAINAGLTASQMAVVDIQEEIEVIKKKTRKLSSNEKAAKKSVKKQNTRKKNRVQKPKKKK
ncbi:MAG TPA: MMPL family transporter [Spirochaetota bacterium]|nr:MMPL family transporter [Spirochaetota bacterium]HPG49058.1 MMPL family transporter [Spirochaetota bacterium]HPN11873.1 MMPL family transporter [Spirochaetota bacterium]